MAIGDAGRSVVKEAENTLISSIDDAAAVDAAFEMLDEVRQLLLRALYSQ